MGHISSPCFDKLPEEKELLRQKSKAIYDQGYSQKEADIRAAQELQHELQGKLGDIFKELKIPESRTSETVDSKSRKKIILNHLLDNEGDVDGAFKKAGYTNIDGFWVEPGAENVAKSLSDETKNILKKNGVKYIDNTNPDLGGHSTVIKHGDQTVRGIGVQDYGEGYAGNRHNHNAIHELGHAVWGDLPQEVRDLFNDQNPLSQHGKNVQGGEGVYGKLYGKAGGKDGWQVGEEDFADQYALNKGDLEKTIQDKKNQSNEYKDFSSQSKTEQHGKEAEKTEKTSDVGKDKVVSGERLEGKPLFSDFNNTIADKETNKLLPFGEEVKQRLENGEKVTIVTASGSEGDKVNEKRIKDALGLSPEAEKNLTIKQGMSPDDKIEAAKGGVLVDNSGTVLEKAREGKVEAYDPTKFGEPEDINEILKEHGEPVASIMDAQRRLSGGERIFAFHEQDEDHPFEIKNVGELGQYTADQLIALPEEYPEPQKSKGSPEPVEKKEISSKGIVEKANKIEDLTDPRSRVLQFFTGGGKIDAAVIGEMWKTATQIGEAKKASEGEKRSRIGLLSKEGAKSIDALAHQLWESDPGRAGPAGGEELHTTEEYKEALMDVLSDHKSVGSMARELVETFITKAEKQREEDPNYVPEELDWSGIEKWKSLSDKEKEAGLTMDDKAVSIINSEGITKDNIETFKTYFDGFPYSEEDYEAVKDYLARQSEGIPGYEKIGGEVPKAGEAVASAAEEAEKPAVTGGGKEPPEPPKEEIREPKENPKEEWTAIRKEKQKEIDAVKRAYESQQEKPWTETMGNALDKLQSSHPGANNLYEAALAELDLLRSGAPSRIFTRDESLAAMQFLKRAIEQKRLSLVEDSKSPIDIVREAALIKDTELFIQLNNTGVAIKDITSEAGTTLNYAQSELGGKDGLELRRMELQQSKGEPLSEEDMEFTAEQWHKDQDLLKQQHDIEIKAMQEKFEKELNKVKESLKKQTGTTSSGKKFDKATASKVANSLKTFADKFEKFGRADLPEGTERMGIDFQKKVADAIRWIAEKIEKGDIRIPDIIAAAIEKYGDKDKDELQKSIHQAMADAGISEKLFTSKTIREKSLNKIKELSESDGSTDITNSMVAKNMIRDYVNSHVGLHDNKEVLDKSFEGLKKVLPDLKKNKLAEAYLKEGEFRQPTKKQLEGGYQESRKSFEKLTKLEKDINDLKEKHDLYKRSHTKSENPYDKDIETKEKEKDRIMVKMGIKPFSGDTYTKASFDQRTKLHNERLDNIGKMIDDKLSGKISESDRSNLLKLKGQLEASKIKLDPNSALSQERTLQGGLDILKSVKSEFARTSDISKTGGINRELQRAIDGFNSDKGKTEQEAKLERAKNKAKNDMKEFQRKIEAEEFEDNPIVALTKSDADLIKINRNRQIIADQFYEKKREYERKNMPALQRIANLGRAIWVARLIGSPFTMGKVAFSAGFRPHFETATKLTAGKAFEALPFSTTKAIIERAKLGGESSSMKSIQKGYEAYFRQYSPEQLAEKYIKASDKYEKSDSEYQKIKGDEKSTPKEIQKAKNKRDNDLKDALGNFVYQYIGGSSIKESVEVLLHRSTSLEQELGNFTKESWDKKKSALNIDNLEYMMDFVGRSHAALKNFSSRYSFASAFMARIEGAMEHGIDISHPDKLLEIAHQSYPDWNRGKYQESNWVSDKWNDITTYLGKVHPALKYLLQFDVAITRVPVNMIHEGIVEYTFGAFKGSVMAAREYYKAKGIVLQDGYTPESEAQFKKELNEQLQKIDPETAATIYRSFRKGGFGLGLYALALLGHAAFGGWAHKGMTAEDKAKKKREALTGVPEIKTGEIKIGDWDMPTPFAKIAEHTPAFAPIGFGIGLAQVYENNILDGKTTPEAAYNTAVAQVNHIVGSVPQFEKVGLPIASDIVKSATPSGKWDDVDTGGNPMVREVFRMSDYLNYLKFGSDNKNILSEHYYKEAVKNQKYYREKIRQVEINTSISTGEKETFRKQYLDELEKSTDDIYRLNKENPQ